MGISATGRGSNTTATAAGLPLQAFAILAVVGGIVGMFVVVGFAAVTVGAFARVAGSQRFDRRDRRGSRSVADVRGDDRGGALYR